MQELLLSHEALVRAAAFLAVLTAVALAELVAPRRPRKQPRLKRWSINLAMVGAGTLLARLAVPLVAVEAALQAQAAGIGLFNQLGWPVWAEVLLAVAALDLVIYGQHVAFHRVPLLWRIHKMHHSDLELDATTGLRFHPLEFGLSMVIKAAAVFALGASVAAVIVFEVLLNATSMFNHGNLKLPGRVDRALRRILVTPDFHIVHHSIEHDELNRNFGFNLPWWDYVFRTYKARPERGPVELVMGISEERDAARLGFWRLLWMPFAGPARARGREAGRSGA